MTRIVCRLTLLIGCLITGVTVAHAQTTPPALPAPQTGAPSPGAPPPMLRVFLDCDSCDEEYLRQNVSFVDYVRDRTVADLHVLVTTQGTGGGGSSWVAKFIGVGRYQGQDRTLSFNTPSTATGDERRREFARIFRIGLVAYAADTSVAPQLDVTWNKPAGTAPTVPPHDPWNYWVFNVSFNGNTNGEASSQSNSFSVYSNANRTTDKWKFSLSTYSNRRTSTFKIDDTTTIKSRTSSWSVDSLAVKSLGPKWSVGGTMSASHSSFSNVARSISVAPGVEYNFFPYSQSARRSFTVRYTAGPVYYSYAQVSVYDRQHEVVPKQYVSATITFRQPWGSLGVFSQFSQQLNHLDRYRESVSGETNVRLFKGFSFSIYASYDRILDQITLAKGAASESDILLRLRQLQTNYSYSMSFGINYSFGSIFNSIVNTRFDR